MTLHVRIDVNQATAIFTCEGRNSADDVCASLDELIRHPDFKPGMDAIAVVEEGASWSLSAADIRVVANFARSRAKQRGSGYKLAFVVSGDVDFGITSMYASWSVGLARDAQVFRSLADARAWIAGRAQSQPP